MKKNTGKLRLEKVTLKNLNAAALVAIAGGSFGNGPSVDGGNSGCGCGNSWQNTCPRTQ